MKRFLFVAGFLAATITGSAVHAEGEVTAQVGCGLATGIMATQDQGSVTILCDGVSEAGGMQLADILNRILVNRLDPQSVLVKLEEIVSIPEDGVARTLNDKQRQTMVEQLIGKQAERVAIVAHPTVADSAEYAKSIATPLLMVGWQIEGNQIRRAAPKPLDSVSGIALFVNNPSAPPEKATRLKAALSAARVMVPLVQDASMPPDATTLWIGKRPVLFSAVQKPTQ
jgi:hypothetical protein